MMLVVLGLGNVWRGGAGSIVGAVFFIAGVVLLAQWLRRQRSESAAEGTATRPLVRDLTTLALPIVFGTTIYVALMIWFDRT